MPRLADPDPPLPEAFSAATAIAAGLTPDQIRQRVRSGAWVRVAKGSYLRAVVLHGLDAYARRRALHEAQAVASARRHPGSVIACESAAVVHRLPLWDPLPDRVRLLVGGDRWTGNEGIVTLRRGELHDSEIAVGPPPVTSPARTWFDIARSSGLAQALTVGDAGIRARLFNALDLAEVAGRNASARGSRRVSAVLPHVDGRRESPLESASWAYFVRHRVPLPMPQYVVRDAGRFVARVDYWWDGLDLVGECDGRVKYLSADDLFAEKRREDQLRGLGLRVVRWGMSDLRSPQLAERLRALTR